MKHFMLFLTAVALAGCTYGHRGAQLDWTPGPAPAFDCSHCDGQHDYVAPIVEEGEETDELPS